MNKVKAGQLWVHIVKERQEWKEAMRIARVAGDRAFFDDGTYAKLAEIKPPDFLFVPERQGP